MNESLKEIIQEQIIDNQMTVFREISPRDLCVEALDGVVSIVTGVRRCGKTTLMESLMQQLVANGVPRENFVWLNFSDERLLELQRGGWDVIHQAYFSKYPEKRHREKVYFFFDEIQIFPNWELFVERLRHEENCAIFITGSSAHMLSKEIGTALRGRTLSWELFPFSFGEYAVRRGVARQGGGSNQRLARERAWQDYKAEGGFPAVYGQSAELRRMLHQEYFNAMLLRDVVERYRIAQPQALRHLASRAINGVGTLFSIRKIHEELKSLGFNVSREMITQYLQWLEDAYFLFSVPAYSASVARQAREFRKIYCVDHALAASLSTRILRNRGQMLENMVFCGLRRQTQDVYYYRTKEGYEVDFIAISAEGDKMLVQVCEDMSADDTRNRELRALIHAMQETKLTQGFIITENLKETIETTAGVINCLPAQQFLASPRLADCW